MSPTPSRRRRLTAALVTSAVAPAAFAANYNLSNQTVDLSLIPFAAGDSAFFSNTTAFSSATDTTIPAAANFANTVSFAGTGNISFSGAVAGFSTLTKNGPAVLYFPGANPNFHSPITINAGTLRIGDAGSLGSTSTDTITLPSGGTLDLNGAVTPRRLFLNGGAVINDNTSSPVTLPNALFGIYTFGGAGDMTVGTLSSSFTLTKIGPGTLTMAQSNAGSWYGHITVDAGTVRVGAAGALGTTVANVTLNPTGRLDLNGIVTDKPYVTFAGGAVANDNTSTPVAINNTSNWTATGAFSYHFSGAGDTALNSSLLSSIPLLKTGPGALTINALQYVHSTSVTGGSLRVGAPSLLNTPVQILPGGAFDLYGQTARPSLLNLAGGALVNDHPSTPVNIGNAAGITFTGPEIGLGGKGDLTYTGILDGSRTLAKVGSGTLTLTSSQFHTGGTTLRDGTLIISAANMLGPLAGPLIFENGVIRNTAAMFLNKSASITGTITGGGFDTLADVTFGATLSGTGILRKTGSATLRLAGKQAPFAGKLRIDQGTLQLVSGDTPLRTTDIDIAPGASLDLTNRRLILDYAPADPSPIDAIRTSLHAGHAGGAWTGTGAINSSSAATDATHRTAIGYAEASTLLSLSPGQTATWFLQPVDATSLLLRYTLYGDATLNGAVDEDDYARLDLAAALGISNPHWTDGDFNYDGAINHEDYLLIDQTFLSQAQGFSPGFLSQRESQFGTDYVSTLLTSIPEPTLPLTLYPLSSLLLRRRPQSSCQPPARLE